MEVVVVWGVGVGVGVVGFHSRPVICHNCHRKHKHKLLNYNCGCVCPALVKSKQCW